MPPSTVRGGIVIHWPTSVRLCGYDRATDQVHLHAATVGQRSSARRASSSPRGEELAITSCIPAQAQADKEIPCQDPLPCWSVVGGITGHLLSQAIAWNVAGVHWYVFQSQNRDL